jgi:hypothetical protein
MPVSRSAQDTWVVRHRLRRSRAGFLPNATIVADKFRVLRLLNPAINRHRKAITGDVRTTPIRRLLLRNGQDLDHGQRIALHTWLSEHHTPRELYNAKEAVSDFYRVRSSKQATRIFTATTEGLARSPIPEIQTFRPGRNQGLMAGLADSTTIGTCDSRRARRELPSQRETSPTSLS